MHPSSLLRPSLADCGDPAALNGPLNWQPRSRGPVALASAPLFDLPAPVQRPTAPVAAPVRRVRPPSPAPELVQRARDLWFEYTGQGSLSVISSISGRHYRFGHAGARLAVDYRDCTQLSRVPDLKRL